MNYNNVTLQTKLARFWPEIRTKEELHAAFHNVFRSRVTAMSFCLYGKKHSFCGLRCHQQWDKPQNNYLLVGGLSLTITITLCILLLGGNFDILWYFLIARFWLVERHHNHFSVARFTLVSPCQPSLFPSVSDYKSNDLEFTEYIICQSFITNGSRLNGICDGVCAMCVLFAN